MSHPIHIIGAGPAGSLTAAALARRGHAVVLLEQHRFPRDKVCGEMLSPLGQTVLARWGLLEHLSRLHPARIERVAWYPMDGTHTTLSLPGRMLGISRRAMDQALLTAAQDAGATIRQHVRVESMRHDATWTLQLRDLDCNRVERAFSEWVVLSDGKSALPGARPALTGDLGVKAHFVGADLPRDTVSLFGLRGHYVGVGPIESNRWNVAMSVPSTRLRALGGDVESLWRTLVVENRALGRAFADAQLRGAWLASSLPRFGVRGGWAENLVPVGNAAAALEPIGGEGMGLALRSAELAVEAINRALRLDKPVDIHGLRRQYLRLWNTRRAICRAGAMILSRPALSSAAARLLRTSEGIGQLALHLSGKSARPASIVGVGAPADG